MKKVEPTNLAAQIAYAARGNPPNTQPGSAIANCFPGLEFDFRNIWRRLFVGIELHEALNLVVNVEPGSAAEAAGVTIGHNLVSVAGEPVQLPLQGPGIPPNRFRFLEWTNALADVINGADRTPECRFQMTDAQNVVVNIVVVRLELRPLFEGPVIARDAADPGSLTQSLCSPWQADYRECACFYWASSRPDFVNVEVAGDQASGHHWLDRDRGTGVYEPDSTNNPALFTYDELYRNWERLLRFQREGKDSEV
jgi:hypothetical protein